MRGLVRAAAWSIAVAVAFTAGEAVGQAQSSKPRLHLQLGAEVGRPTESVTVEVTSLDAAGARVDTPARLAIDADIGRVSPPQRVATGVYRASLTIPAALPGSRTALVLARAGALSAEASLTLVPGPAATMDVEGPESCPEDVEVCRIEVAAQDAHGNPAAEIPDASAALGTVSPAGSSERGRWVIVYHPPRVDRQRTEEVKIELGKLRGAHSFVLSPARTRIGFAPLAGAVRQDGRYGFAAGGQVMGERLLASGWLMGAGIQGTWWRTSRSGQASGLDVSTDRSQLAAGFFVTAEKPIAGRLTAMISAGGGAVRVSSTVHVEQQPGVTDSGWAPTADGSVGLGYRIPSGMPFVALRAAWVGDAHLATDPGAEWPMLLLVGYRLDVR